MDAYRDEMLFLFMQLEEKTAHRNGVLISLGTILLYPTGGAWGGLRAALHKPYAGK